MPIQPFNYSHGDVALKGYLAVDPSRTDKRPGVLVIPDFMGPDTPRAQERAQQMSALGYVGFVVDMYGVGHQPTTREEAGAAMGPLRNDRALLRARVTAAFDALKNNAHVDPSRIAIMGFCFGGMVALELARNGAALRGAISVHGGLDTPHPESSTITSKILVLHGAEDPTVAPAAITAFMDEMRAAKADWQFVFYSGAKHGFTNPDADKIGSPAVAYQPAADRRSQIAVREFLAEIFV